MLKVLVTGSNGQLGKEFKKNISFNSLFETNYCSKEECDISDFIKTEKILRTYKPNILINCAAYTNVDKAEIHKNEANIINNLAVENLAKLSKILNITLIHFSTDYVFGKCINRPFKENDKKNPINYYGMTKHLGEEKIINIAKKYFIFRVSWLYSIYGNNFPKTIMSLTKVKNELDVVNDQIGIPTSTTFVVAIVENILQNFQANHNLYGVYNCVPYGECSWNEIANKILDKNILDKKCVCKKINPVNSEKFNTIAKRPFYSVLNNESLISNFNLSLQNWEYYFDNFLNDIQY